MSMENDPWLKMAGYNIRSKKERIAFAERERRRMVVSVTELAERLGISDDVEIVTDLSGLQGRQRRAKGIYRKSAAEQGDLFAGGIKSKEDILKDVINFINNNYGRNKKIEEAKAAALERRKAEGIQQDDAGEAGGGGSENTGGGARSPEEAASLTHDEAIELIAKMEERAEIAKDVALTIENWDKLFAGGKVYTPLGEVKMGENQFTKLMRQGRNGKLGMVKPTLENPDVVIEDTSDAKEGDVAERGSSYVFIKAFKKADGSRFYYFTSVTVSKDGKEVVISNQEKRKNAIAHLLSNGKLVWKHADDVSAASDVEQGLYSPQGEMSDPATEGTDAPQTNIKPIVFTRPALVPDTNTDTSGVDSGQSDGVTTPAGNSPQTSAGKVTEKENSVQTVDDKIEKGNTLQTAASQPHGGIALYRDILANVLISAGKDSDNPPSSQGLKERPLLWERGADFAPEDVATPTISTIEPQQGDETSSRTKGQSNASSAGKVTEKKFRANFYRKCGGGNGYRPERSAEESRQL